MDIAESPDTENNTESCVLARKEHVHGLFGGEGRWHSSYFLKDLFRSLESGFGLVETMSDS